MSACDTRSHTLFRTSSGSGLFSTTNCDGWNDSLMSSARALAPNARSSAALSATIEWNCGMSGCVAYGAMSDDIRYIRIRCLSQ